MLHDSKKTFTEPDNRRKLGNTGELLVITHLEQDGYIIAAQNYQKKYGEIDIVARKDDVVAFVEVKLRKKKYFATSEVITPSKQRKIIATAKAFILEHKIYNALYRFDVALVTFDHNKQPDITYIPNAFTQREHC
jgi:putative endonuclease